MDDSGRNIGPTLWHALVIVESATGESGPDGMPKGAHASIWATAGSLRDMEHLIEAALAKQPQWTISDVYTIDRVAFDERPESLAQLPAGRRLPEVHLMTIEPWDAPSSGESAASAPAKPKDKSPEKPKSPGPSQSPGKPAAGEGRHARDDERGARP